MLNSAVNTQHISTTRSTP